MKIKNKNGVTLIILIVTVVILVILAGISVKSILDDDGIVKETEIAASENERKEIRKKLEEELMSISSSMGDGNLDESVIDEKLRNKGITVNGNLVVIDGYVFEIDKSIPAIKESLGKGQIGNNIEIYLDDVVVSEDGGMVTISGRIIGCDEIERAVFDGKEISVRNDGSGFSFNNLTVTSSGIYSLMVKDKTGNFQVSSINLSGVQNDLYIYNIIDLRKFRDEVNNGNTFENKTIQVMANININGSESDQWLPIADRTTNSTASFKGVFEGNNCTISGIYINGSKQYQGLFRENEGTIQNLKISGSVKSTNSNSYIGLLVGSNNGEIKNVISSGEVIGENYTGGITGINQTKAKITGCENKASINKNKLSGEYIGRNCRK